MKALLLFLGLAFGICSAMAAEPSYGSHGMVLFGGKDALYTAHLPMFHAPHDYQAVLEVRLADGRQDRALRSRLAGKPVLWTVSPEEFTLANVAEGFRFKADVVLGHFEKGGSTQLQGVTLEVKRVLLLRQLQPAAATKATARYLQLGQGKRRYLVKEVDSRPDFDHIVAVSVPAALPARALTVPKQALDETRAAALAGALPGARIDGTIYYSTEDLK